MRFTLYYKGPLRSNRGPTEKQQIRRALHPQLRCLWLQPPLDAFRDWLSPVPKHAEVSLIETVGSFQFAPLISERIHMIAELDIEMLRPGPPGDLISHAGDLDNRIKTLLDALRVPREATSLPKNDAPQAGESPFYCLLSDDRLVTHLSVRTDRLLDDFAKPDEVVLLMHITTRALTLTYANVGLGS